MNCSSRSMYLKLRVGCRALISCCLFAVAGSLSAQTLWTNPSTNNWNTPGNWTLGVPNSASGTTFDAVIENGGTAQLLDPGASVRRLRVGRAAGPGHLQVNAGDLTVTDNFHLNEGSQPGQQTLVTVQLGGTVTAPATVVGYSSTGHATFFITGAGSTVDATTSFVVGRAASGSLILADGGTLAIGGGTLPLQIATVAGSFGEVNIGHGGAAGVLEASAVQFGAGSGSFQFNHTDDLTFVTPINGPGVVSKRGPGTTTLSGINTYTGATLFSGGTLAISADAKLGTPPAIINPQQLQFYGGTLRATESFTLAATRGITSGLLGGAIEVDAGKTLTYLNNLNVSFGTMTKTGAGALAIQNLSVGASGASGLSALHVAGGGTLDVVAHSAVGSNNSSSATVSGSGTTWTTNTLTIGRIGTSTLEIVDGGTVRTAASSYIADVTGATGIATVRGVGSAWIVGGDLDIGDGGDGTLNIEDLALVHVGDRLSISSSSTVNLSGGTLRFNGYFRESAGTFNFNFGTVQLAGNRNVGTDAAIKELFGAAPVIPTGKGLTVEENATISSGLTLNGGSFRANNLIVNGPLHFGGGILELTGGTITGLTSLAIPTNGEFRARGVQSLRITGAAGSAITATGNLTLGNAAVVNGFGTQGTLQVGANTVTLLDANDVVFDSLALATLGNAGNPGTLIAANGLTLDFGGNLTGFGTVSTPNNVAKPLINNGHITGNSVAQRITLPGYVKGVGTFNHVNFTGTFDPGLSPTLTTGGSITFAPTNTLIMELGGTSRGGQYDAILASGTLGLGGTLNVTLIDGFHPAAGNTFDLLDWSTRSGTFASINLPGLAGLAWNTSQLYTTGEISLAAAGLTGDYNGNGIVDAADYTVWRDTLGSTTNLAANGNGNMVIDAGDLTVWQANFGATLGSGAHEAAAVPEPRSLALLLFGLPFLASAPLSVRVIRRGRRFERFYENWRERRNMF